MFNPLRHGAARAVAIRPQQQCTLPDFLIPRFSQPALPSSNRVFSTSRLQQSRIGSAPLSLPEGVTLTVIEPPAVTSEFVKRVTPLRKVEVNGPDGQLFVDLPHYMTLSQDADTKKATLSIEDRNVRKQREMWGTTRATLQNHIMGVTEGHTTILRLNGVGYRALVESSATTKQPEYDGQKFVSLKVGYSHPIELPVPRGVKASTPQPTRILLEGDNKEVINQFAAEIRNWRKPEPYKGKGIFVNGETIKLKSKKIK